MYARVRTLSSHPPPAGIRSWKLPLSDTSTPFRQFEGLGILAYSCDGKRIAVGNDKQFQVLDRNTQEVLHQFTQPGSQSGRVWFSPDGKWIASGEWTLWMQSVQLWNTADASHWRIDTVDYIPAVAFTADSKEILVVRDSHWEIWNLATRQVVHTERLPDKSSLSVAISQDRKLLAVVTIHETAYVWTIDDRRLRARFRIHPRPTEEPSIKVCFAADDSLLITASDFWFHRFNLSLSAFRNGWYMNYYATEFKVWDATHWNCVHRWQTAGEYQQLQSIPRSRQFLAMDRRRLDVWELPAGLGTEKP